MFECVRCTRKVIDEECYLFIKWKYCRACWVTIQNDPHYELILKREIVMARLRQIEN